MKVVCPYCDQQMVNTEDLQEQRLIADNIYTDLETRTSWYCTNSECFSKTTRGQKKPLCAEVIYKEE